MCQPIRSLQVGPDLPDKPHVRVNVDHSSGDKLDDSLDEEQDGVKK